MHRLFACNDVAVCMAWWVQLTCICCVSRSQVKKCLSIKGAEDAINKPHAFEVSTTDDAMFFIADSDKDKEDWINAVGRAIVKHSRR